MTCMYCGKTATEQFDSKWCCGHPVCEKALSLTSTPRKIPDDGYQDQEFSECPSCGKVLGWNGRANINVTSMENLEDKIAVALSEAYEQYTKFFLSHPNGTPDQMKALLQFKVIRLIKDQCQANYKSGYVHGYDDRENGRECEPPIIYEEKI